MKVVAFFFSGRSAAPSGAWFSVAAVLFVTLTLVSNIVSRAEAATINLRWNANSEADLAGYRVYHGSTSRGYSSVVDVGNQHSFSLPGVVPESQTYFAVTAYDLSGNESGFSQEVVVVAPPDNNPDAGLDSDNDGITDSLEREIGTDPYSADTDGDGVSDGQEVVDGSNPLDRGSSDPMLGSTLCGEWNGFLGGMWNILELVNLSSRSISGSVALYSQLGELREVRQFVVNANAQQDLLVHDFNGRVLNSYGKVCVNHNGGEGTLDGRMVYYRERRQAAGFEFAFAMPFSNGNSGSQFVPFNTFQPSLAVEDATNPVANWIQLTNLSDISGRGALVYYDMTGAELGAEFVQLRAGERRDFAGHRFGVSRVGLVEWRPGDANRYQLRNVRYVYDNPSGIDSFETAFQLEGGVGSGQELVAPLTTVGESAILELSNTAELSIDVRVKVFSEQGTLLRTDLVQLASRASQHLILDSIVGAERRGSVAIQSNRAGSLLGILMQYARRDNGGVKYMYGIPLKQALPVVVKGSYNTFLSQTSELLLTNAANVSEPLTMSLIQSGGEMSAGGIDLVIVSRGMNRVLINDFEAQDVYGVVTAQAEHTRAIVGWMIRRRGDDFAMPAPLR